MEIVVFEIDHNRYAVNVHDIDELLNMASFKSLPEAPGFIAGVFNLRGQLLPVIDFAYFVDYNRPPPPPPLSLRESVLSPYPNGTRLLVFSNAPHSMLLIIDAMQCIQKIDDASIKPALTNKSTTGNFLAGMVVEADAVTYLVDIKRLLTDDELSQLTIEVVQ